MITATELNPHKYPTTPEIDKNLEELLDKLNKIRDLYGKPMTITSGLRDEAKQQELITDGKSTASHSKHLLGLAADVYDPSSDFWRWCMINMSKMVEIGIWFEDRKYTPTWTHAQIVPPSSGKRIFIP